MPAPATLEGRHHVAVVLAGGVGSRVGRGVPKQLIELAGRPILEHSIAAFDAHAEVDEVVVVMTPGHLDAVHGIVRSAGFTKVTHVLEGADTRSGSSVRALDAIPHTAGEVLLHDAARPLVSRRVIHDCFRTLETDAAVCVGIASSDTIVEVDSEDLVRAVPRRAGLRHSQTPQGFSLPVIREAYARAARDPAFEATDDCSVVLRYLPEVPIRVVAGDERNIKVTRPTDLHLAELLLRLRAEEGRAEEGPGEGDRP